MDNLSKSQPRQHVSAELDSHYYARPHMPTMKQYTDQKVAAWHEHAEQFKCEHERSSLRRRVIKGGAVQYVQCLRCGESRNQPLAKAKALEACGGAEPPSFDDLLRDEWEQRRTEAAEAIKEKFSREAFFADYDPYLKSPAWAKRRSLVLKRTGGVCEGCGTRPSTQVHHLSYKHVGAEFLFELVGVCDECHERLHEDE